MQRLVWALCCTFFTMEASHAAKLSSCNFAPYSVAFVVLEGSTEGSLEIANSIDLAPGRCENQEFEIQVGKTYHRFAMANLTSALFQLRTDDGFLRFWKNVPAWGNGSDVTLCINQSENGDVFETYYDQCPQGHSLVQVQELSHAKINRGHTFSIIDNYICDKIRSFSCSKVSLEELANWANGLHASLQSSYQRYTDRSTTYGIFPYGAGFATKDQNGPFEAGVTVTDKMDATRLGSPISVQRGDLILSLNGSPVFDVPSLAWHIYQHGLNEGYKQAADLIILRNSQFYSIPAYLHFHRDVYSDFFLNRDGSCRRPNIAALLAGLEEITLYQQSKIACLSKAFYADGFSVDSQCKFEFDQIIAAYSQFCGSASSVGMLAGGFYLPLRNFIEKSSAKFFVKSQHVAGRLLRAGAIEGIEEGLRTTATLAPGIKWQDSLDGIGTNAAFGATLGSIFAIGIPGGVK